MDKYINGDKVAVSLPYGILHVTVDNRVLGYASGRCSYTYLRDYLLGSLRGDVITEYLVGCGIKRKPYKRRIICI